MYYKFSPVTMKLNSSEFIEVTFALVLCFLFCTLTLHAFLLQKIKSNLNDTLEIVNIDFEFCYIHVIFILPINIITT